MRLNYTLLSLCIFFLHSISFGYSKDSLRTLFQQGIRDISTGRFERAQPIFETLCLRQPQNANFNYLLGICYTEQQRCPGKAVACLEMAEKSMSEKYDVDAYHEKKVPIYVYYYLTLAYSQNGQCEKALSAREHFLSYYNFYVEYDYFIEESKKWVKHCVSEHKEDMEGNSLILQASSIKSNDTATVTPIVNAIQHAPISKRKIVSHQVYYTVSSPVWGVQVGAFKQFLPVGVFDDLKNVDAFIDKTGMLRYVIGHFAHRKQAETLLEVIREQGYGDAYIVNISSEKKFTSEVLMVDNYSLKSRIKGDVELKIQIGVFRDSIPKYLAEKYLLIDGIEEYEQNGLSMMAVGSFGSYGAAAAYRDELLRIGIPGAFIIAMNKGRKIPLRQALAYLKKHYDKGM